MKSLRLSGILITVLLTLVMFTFAFAQIKERVATIVQLSGKVEVMTTGGVWSNATKGMVLNQGDTIRAAKGASALLNLDGNGQTATVELKENSEMELSEMVADEQKGAQRTLLDLSLGNILIKAKKLHSEQSSFEVKTPTSVVAVRGTTFAVSVEAVE